MIRRDFLGQSAAFLAGGLLPASSSTAAENAVKKIDDRAFWVQTLTRIGAPVLDALSQGELKKRMLVEAQPGRETDRKAVTHLEALGRLLAGMSPWLELGPDNTPEGKLREKFADLARQSIRKAVDPASPDYMNFSQGGQPLVDAAFLSHALLRAPTQLTQQLDSETKRLLIAALMSTRSIQPGYSNWLLFSAMVEAGLFVLGEKPDRLRVDYAVRQHLAWYKGDGCYGDGPPFHFDYYNSFVIHPMLLDVVRTLDVREPAPLYETVLARSQRYAEIQERLISPEGTFPAVGRSLAYRFGAFQLLSQIALMKKLPPTLVPAQVRSALTAVIRRMIEAPGTFDAQGWLTIGFCGHQLGIGETYISTGSLYLCTTGLLTLGLPPSDEFWTAPATDWTAKKLWSGTNLPVDHALHD
jgi:hypothetical protein